MSSLASTQSVLLGDQSPRIFHAPPGVDFGTAGDDAIELAAACGLILDPWQQFVLRGSLATKADRKWSAFEVGLVVSRQNGKGSVIEARELAGLFLFNEQLIMHSAHLFKTSLEAFRRILNLLEAGGLDTKAHIKRVSRSHGEEGIELVSGQRLQFATRTAGGGRGLSGDTVILDEAMILPESAIEAVMPTMSARSVTGNPQVWYTGSAGNESSTVFGSVRARGIDAEDPRLCFMEWSAPDDADPSDPAAWAQANPGLGIRIASWYVENEQKGVFRGNPVGFARERLGIGTWPAIDAAGWPIPEPKWAACADPASQPQGMVVVALDVSPDRVSSIAAAGRRADGLAHCELIANKAGTSWVVERLVAIQAKSKPAAILLDPSGPAGALITALQEAGIEPHLVSGREMAQACGAFESLVLDEQLRHLGDPIVTDALAAAKWRDLADAKAWGRKTSAGDISSLVAVTLAVHGHAVHAPQTYDLMSSFW